MFFPTKSNRGRGGRALRRDDASVPALLTTTVALAAGVAIVELPCTAGLPMLWGGLVADAAVGAAAYAGLLAAYLAAYLAVEVAILTAAVATLRAIRVQSDHGRYLKLVSGVVMLALAGVLATDPTLMESLPTAAAVIGGALTVSAAVIAADQLRQRARR